MLRTDQQNLRKFALAAMISLLFSFSSLAKANERSLEYQVKATYLYKFQPFVDWPPSAVPTDDTPIVICIAGRDPFGASIDRAISDVKIGSRAVVLNRLAARSEELPCHILFIGGSQTTIKRWLEQVREKPVLTVTEQEANSNETGIINFVNVNGRIRFEVDNVRAREAGLILSTKLLALATAVKAVPQRASL